MSLEQATPADADVLRDFLTVVDLTLSGLESETIRLWVERDDAGVVVASTGYELAPDGQHVLVRSVAVAPDHRSAGRGTRLARFALEQAAAEGATTAWLFSRRSGPFWQSLGFEPADRDALTSALEGTHQVELFRQTGQLEREVAWSRPL